MLNRNMMSTIAGTRAMNAHDDVEGQFNLSIGLAMDAEGNVIVADAWNHRICKITQQGEVSTLAGTDVGGHRDGEGAFAQFRWPSGVAVDGGGNVIVADNHNHRIRKITPHGRVSTLAGTGEWGHRDGEGTIAQFNWPRGVAVDRGGNVIVTDMFNHRIRKITQQGHVSTLAGTGSEGYQDGEGTIAQFDYPMGVAVDGDGNVIVTDEETYGIRKITPQGHVSTLASTGKTGHRDRVLRWGIAVDGGGNVIVTDNHRIHKITPRGHVSSLAGTGETGLLGRDQLASAHSNQASGVALDENGIIFAADTRNHCILRMASVDAVTATFRSLLPPLLQSSFVSDIQWHRLFSDVGSIQDVCFVVEQERVHAHRGLLSARCEYFRYMFKAGFREGNTGDIHIKGTSSGAFKALLYYLYTDNMEVDDTVVFDLVKLCDQYRVERLHNHCLHQLFNGIIVSSGTVQAQLTHSQQ
jgi:DNA-binding beta-propeller fold protein YncE